MTGMMLIFVVVFVLVLAASCALLVLRMLGPVNLPDSPPFPRRHLHVHRHHYLDPAPNHPVQPAASEDLAPRS